jgi:hypothetical protein
MNRNKEYYEQKPMQTQSNYQPQFSSPAIPTTNYQSVYQTQVNGNSYIQYQQDDCMFVDSFKLTSAVAMRVLEPHQVISYTNNLPRISCTVSFKQDISYLLN